MSKYAVVKIGASQEKVSIGDELVVSSSFSETTLIPILVSPKKGELVSDKVLLSLLIDARRRSRAGPLHNTFPRRVLLPWTQSSWVMRWRVGLLDSRFVVRCVVDGLGNLWC